MSEEPKRKQGFAAIDPGRRRELGRIGGLRTKERKLAEDPDFYHKIGVKGGNKMLQERGIEYFSQIGKMGVKERGLEPKEEV